MHAEHLEAAHGVGPHTISVPKVRAADDIDPDEFDGGVDSGISDDLFAKIIAIIRIAVPYTGMIMSTRENQQILNCCHPNTLMTLKEYLVDYAGEETRAAGEALIEKELGNIPKEKVRKIAEEYNTSGRLKMARGISDSKNCRGQ